MSYQIAVDILAGVGLLLYGMTLMGSGLEKAAGERLKKIIEMLTSSRFVGILVGTLITGIIQSSSATTVMIVGFVNAGIMKLTQAVGIIMGANIGTTITGQIISFDLEQIAPVFVGIGMIIYLSSSKEKTKHIAQILVGFGMLFMGMEYLKDAVKPLRDIAAFKDILKNFGDNQFLGILMGFGLTIITHSSSASIGMLMAIASQGLVPIESAMALIYGYNIGTCTTAVISSIGASKNAKRAGIIHISFNIIGTIIFVFIVGPIIKNLIVYLNPNDIIRQIANAHTLFNVTNVIIQAPFAMLLIKLSYLIIPDKEGDEENKSTKYLDERILETPSIALSNTIREIIRMGNKARESFESAMNGLFYRSKEEINKTFEKERRINELERMITEYLVKISHRSISKENRDALNVLFHTINDIERVGDHADNIAELANIVVEKDLPFSEDAINDLNIMYNKVLNAYKYSLEAMETGNVDLAHTVVQMEQHVDVMERSCRTNHIYRLNNSLCNPEGGIIYLDIISNMERIADHASNIARNVIDAKSKKQF